jgi:hypothetical protein
MARDLLLPPGSFAGFLDGSNLLKLKSTIAVRLCLRSESQILTLGIVLCRAISLQRTRIRQFAKKSSHGSVADERLCGAIAAKNQS